MQRYLDHFYGDTTASGEPEPFITQGKEREAYTVPNSLSFFVLCQKKRQKDRALRGGGQNKKPRNPYGYAVLSWSY